MINTLIESIKYQAQKNSNNIALLYKDSATTYEELISKIEQLTNKLKKSGIKPFDRIGILLDNKPDDLILALSLLNCLAVIVPIPYHYTDNEVKKHLRICATNILLDKERLKPIKFSFDIEENKLPKVLFKKNYQSINETPAIIRPTSGTTGKQKGVILTYKSILSRIDYANQVLNITENDNIFWCLSIAFHLAVSIMLFLKNGATINFQELNKLSISKNKINKPLSMIYATPWHYQLLANTNSIDEKLFRHLRFALSTATNLPIKTANQFLRRFNHPIRQAYGIIEAGLVAINYKTPPDDVTSVGRICPGFNVKIKDIYTKEDLGQGNLGEIYIKSNALFAGYVYGSNEYLKKGWFATGDIGLIQDNVLFLKGRTKSVINIGGLKFFPEEVESAIEEHPAIKSAWIYPKFDPRFGQTVRAKLIKNKKNHEDISILEQEIKKFLYTRLSNYKIPLEFEFVSKIPLTKTGKKLRCPLPFPAEVVVPHSAPMLLIDKLLERDRQQEYALLQANIPSSGPFIYQNQIMEEYLIELCAQSMAVVNGYDAWIDDAKSTKGFLVGIEDFNYNLPSSFEKEIPLYIEIRKQFQFSNITIMKCIVYYKKQKIVYGSLKVWSE